MLLYHCLSQKLCDLLFDFVKRLDESCITNSDIA
jgi:hypothetical protein